ncbi:MAG: DUF72 domain-containing protein [Gammaproteobacteria bacterium]|nr:DUF72 domain-containing protein [Gammaproteobacteria bacterium]
MKLYCGTSGFSFKEWKGPFYPAKLPAGEMLAFYGSRLPTVEINNTFYRMPRQSVLEGWAAQVPDSFCFAIKAPRRISHVKQLRDCEQEAGYFFKLVAVLGARLGAVLVQLPPHARADVEKLKVFLKLVPGGIPVAFEFRHASWKEEGVYAALKDHGAAWVTADNDGDVPPALPETAAWAYLRLRAPDYPAETLRKWKQRCEPFDRAFIYFKHEDDAAGPAFAERMIRL